MARRFFDQAEHDLDSAHWNVETAGYAIAANLTHRAAEKALKAAHWYVRAEEPPWTQDLRACAERVATTLGSLPSPVDLAIAPLTPLIERTRYPAADPSVPIPAVLVGV